MKKLVLLMLVAISLIMLNAPVAKAEMNMQMLDFCDAAEDGPGFTNMDDCAKRFEALKAEGKTPKFHLIMPLSYCGMDFVETLLNSQCGNLCNERSAECAPCINKTDFLKSQSANCGDAMCTSIDPDTWQCKDGQCVQK